MPTCRDLAMLLHLYNTILRVDNRRMVPVLVVFRVTRQRRQVGQDLVGFSRSPTHFPLVARQEVALLMSSGLLLSCLDAAVFADPHMTFAIQRNRTGVPVSLLKPLLVLPLADRRS